MLKMLARGSKIRLKRHSIDLLTQRTVIERMIRLISGYVDYFQFAIFPSAGFAIRDCDTDGVWKPNYDQNATAGWTNYTDCFKLDPALVGITVSWP